MAFVSRKTVKKFVLLRRLELQESSSDVDIFQPSHSACYTRFTESQPHKNCCCLAENSRKTQFTTLTEAAKKLALCKFFSIRPFCTLHKFSESQSDKNLCCLSKKNFESQILLRQLKLQENSRGGDIFQPSHSACYTRFTESQPQKKQLLFGRKQSKNTICHVN